MQENRSSILVMGDDPEAHIVVLDEAALDEISGGSPLFAVMKIGVKIARILEIPWLGT